MHYTVLLDRYKGDIAHTWQVLNDITGQRKQIELCDNFNINIIPTNDANEICNAFCNCMTKGLLQSSLNLQKLRKGRLVKQIVLFINHNYRNVYNRLVRIARYM